MAIYLLAVCTPVGQRAENAVFDLGVHDMEKAWIYPWSGAAYGSTPLPPLEASHTKTLIVGLAVIAVVTLVRRCWWQGCAAVGVVVAAIGCKEVLKPVLPRPDLVNARESLIEGSFPSGHAAIPAALTLGVILVASPRIRPYVATVGVLWLACIAAAVQALGHHRPSDVLGSTLLACVCYSLVVWLLPTAAAPDITRSPRALPPVALALSAAVALVAGVRSDSLARSLIDSAAGFVCALLLWYTATEGPAHSARRTRPTPG
ncbi:phosphatase PAP2 family protein [Streptomyces sp. NPDC050287]|uniref:phosphatase PAP2 family protein n=1 Tax=Streptomyces sp. NPDC050287 TaxID=3365608 RepID=UPI0037880679